MSAEDIYRYDILAIEAELRQWSVNEGNKARQAGWDLIIANKDNKPKLAIVAVRAEDPEYQIFKDNYSAEFEVLLQAKKGDTTAQTARQILEKGNRRLENRLVVHETALYLAGLVSREAAHKEWETKYPGTQSLICAEVARLLEEAI